MSNFIEKYFLDTKLMHSDDIFMQRCLQLATKALGHTYPNPIVGCVIVHQGKIIGEGWHKKAGQAHAEVEAIQNVVDKSVLKKATVYVSLEPCNHFGKTPPCVDLLIQHQVKKVVVGTLDPNPLVAGQGVQRLKDHGIEVVVGCLNAACQESNKRFFTFQNKKRPFIILKWAESADGFIAPNPAKRSKNEIFWLSDSFSQQLVHQWRSQEQAILIGAKTLMDDNPKLNVRHWSGQNPLPFVLSKPNTNNKSYHLVKNNKLTYLKKNQKNKKLTIDQILEVLYQKNIQSVFIEGGRSVLQQFIDAQQWDEIRIFQTESFLKEGITAPSFTGQPTQKQKLVNDTLVHFRNRAEVPDRDHLDSA